MAMSNPVEAVVASLVLDHNLLSLNDAMDMLKESRAQNDEVGDRLLSILFEKVNEVDVLRAIASDLDIPFYDLSSPDRIYDVSEDALRSLDLSTLKRYNAIPLVRTADRRLFFGTAAPETRLNDYLNTKIPAQANGERPFSYLIMPRTQIQDRLAFFEARSGTILDISLPSQNISSISSSGSSIPLSVGGGSPVVGFVDNLLVRAVAQGASDIHLQYTPDKQLDVRFRIDGTLSQLPIKAQGREKEIIGALLSKASTIDPANLREPQDGTFNFNAAGRTIDTRVSLVPSINGPAVVIRLLDSKNLMRRLDDMGFNLESLATMRQAANLFQGTIVMSGPTGSGKTSTLYSLLKELDAITKNIMTIEDPVEYKLENIRQIQVEAPNARGDRSFTFARALRATLRQDPDVLLVGEIRDKETAEIALTASTTGHLVFTTLHANDALGVYMRLTDLGIDASTVNNAMSLAISQRLLRKVHDCARKVAPTLAEKEYFHRLGSPVPEFVMQPAGCSACGNSGYQGRLAVIETIVATPKFKELFAADAPKPELLKEAAIHGFVPIVFDGLRHVIGNRTTVSEAERVLSMDIGGH